jgi:hypothetical protein
MVIHSLGLACTTALVIDKRNRATRRTEITLRMAYLLSALKA